MDTLNVSYLLLSKGCISVKRLSRFSAALAICGRLWFREIKQKVCKCFKYACPNMFLSLLSLLYKILRPISLVVSNSSRTRKGIPEAASDDIKLEESRVFSSQASSFAVQRMTLPRLFNSLILCNLIEWLTISLSMKS